MNLALGRDLIQRITASELKEGSELQIIAGHSELHVGPMQAPDPPLACDSVAALQYGGEGT